MLKAKIEIDNVTAYSMSPMEFIVKHILKDAECIRFDKNTNTIYCKNIHAAIKIKNVRQI